MVRKSNDLTGKTFGRLTVIRRGEDYVSPRGNRCKTWVCECSCGNPELKTVQSWNLGRKTVSCGCYQREKVQVHGQYRTRTYYSYRNMLARCYNEKDPDYARYGGRGISVCDRWREDYRNFFTDMGECPDGLTLDRKDVDGNYEPGNCTWVTSRVQANNRRNTVYTTYKGERWTMGDLARELGLSTSALRYRVLSGWPEEKWSASTGKEQRGDTEIFHSKWDKETRLWKIGLCVQEEERTMALRYMEQILRFGRPHTLNEALNLLYAQQGEDLIKHEEFFRQLLDRQPVNCWYDIMQNEYDRLGHRMCAKQDSWLASIQRGA